MRPNPSDPERTATVAIVATRLRSERLGELRPEQHIPASSRARADLVIGLSQTRLRKLGSSGVTSSMHWSRRGVAQMSGLRQAGTPAPASRVGITRNAPPVHPAARRVGV
jgi:hypothetical protein